MRLSGTAVRGHRKYKVGPKRRDEQELMKKKGDFSGHDNAQLTGWP